MDRVIAGKYSVEGVLGRGGMGLVLKARHLRLDELVAIKVLHASLLNDESMAARMLREARAALRLQSEHIVRVMDVDTLENGVPFMVMEYLEGIDVSVLVRKRGGQLPWEQAVAIADQTCRALAEAHALGIVHRDLKPANLFVVERPDGRRVVKLLDFGISKLSVPREAPITKKGDILGSPRYMAPEQVRGEALDGRADLWSVGVVLYEMLAGKPPFPGDNFAITCKRVLDEAPEPLSTLRPDVPPGLCAAIHRCLEKDRGRRFPDATALRDAIAPFGALVVRTGSQASLSDLGTWDPAMSQPVPLPAPTSGSTAPPPPSSGSGAPPLPASRSGAPPPPASRSGAPPPFSSRPGPSSPAPPGAPADEATLRGGRALLVSPLDAETAKTSVPPMSAADAGEPSPLRRSRAFLGVALVGLLLGLGAGIALLLREPSGATSAASASPTGEPAPAAAPTSPGNAQQASSAPTSEPSTAPSPASEPAAASSAAPTGAAAASTADPSRPARRTGAGGSTKPTAGAVDPFGERRK